MTKANEVNSTTDTLLLRKIEEADLPTLFEQQRDQEANFMAAFTAKDPEDRGAFNAHWSKIMGDESIIIQTILFNGEIAGSISSHAWFGKPEVSYWIGKSFWGRGIATKALSAFLEIHRARPLYARVAKDNKGSIRVLEKCGFRIYGEDKGYSNARGIEVEEYVMVIN